MLKNITRTDNLYPYILHGICTQCMSQEEHDNNIVIKNREEKLHKIWETVIADEIMCGTEELLEDFLCDYIETIEEGMVFLKRQVKIDYGIIDILAKDKNNTGCIIELKVKEPEKNIIWQASYYPSYFGSEEIRMITIAPNYPLKIYKALEKVKNVEMKIFFKNEEGKLEITEFEKESIHGLHEENSNEEIQEVI
ncbi:hypothetical protein CON21_26345 [Bacillus thuringiensis]|nr:hypothetical protein CON21_26345 [Bacillus thuringiensis]